MENLEPFSLNEQYSTTRLVSTKILPIAEENYCHPETLLFLPFIDGRKGEGGLRTRGYFKVSLPEKPLITVITVVFNGDKFLEKTILSVINQSYENVEYIIIDGGSTDSTLDIIKKYEHAIDYWISEIDRGIYDAMNKGISLGSGSYVLFLGADDRLNSVQTLLDVSDVLKIKQPVILFGSIIYESDGTLIKSGQRINSRLDWQILIHNTVHHQSCFYHKSLFLGWKYDASLKLISDYELNLIIYQNKLTVCSNDIIISICGSNGVSQSKENLSIFQKETNKIRKRLIQKPFFSLIFYIIFQAKVFLFLVKIRLLFLCENLVKR